MRQLYFLAILMMFSARVWGQCTGVIADFWPNPDNACSGTAVQLTAVTAGNPANALYVWNFGDGSGPDTGTVMTHSFGGLIGSGMQVFNVVMQVFVPGQPVACDADTVGLVVNPLPDVDITTPGTPMSGNVISKCGSNLSSYTLQVKNNSSTFSDNTGYMINWGDGSPVQTLNNTTFPSGTPISHTYTSVGTKIITITATGSNGCTNTKFYTFFLGSNPGVGLSAAGNTIGLCAPVNVTALVNTAVTSNNTPGTTYSVFVNDDFITSYTQNSLPPTISYNFLESSCGESYFGLNNAFTLRIRAENPCGYFESTVSPITINAAPIAEIGVDYPAHQCPNETYVFTNESEGAASISVTNDCDDSQNVEWSISPATYTVVSGDLYSSPLGVAFTQPGTYTVTMIVNNATYSCGGDTAVTTVTVLTPPSADANAQAVPAGDSCATVQVSFTNLSTGSFIGYEWDVTPTTGVSFVSGTDSSSANPVIRFNVAGTYHVELTTSNACNHDIWDTTIVVRSKPVLILDTIPGGCAPTVLNFSTSNFHVVEGGLPTTYAWQFTGASPVSSTQKFPTNIAYNAAGTYTVSVTATNGCGTDSEVQTFALTVLPGLAGTASNDTLCAPDTLTLTDASVGSSSRLWSITPATGWNFTGGTNQNSLNAKVNFTAVGTYYVSLSGTNECGTVTLPIDTIVVRSRPTLAVDNVSSCDTTITVTASMVTTTNGGFNNINWSWTSTGIPATATGAPPKTFDFPPNSTNYITVTVSNGCGNRKDTVTVITAAIPVEAISHPAVTDSCGPYQVNFSNTSQHITSYNWTVNGSSASSGGGYAFVGGTGSSSASPQLNFTGAGTYVVNCTLNNPCQTLYWTDTFRVVLPPVITPFTLPASCDSVVNLPSVAVNNGGIVETFIKWHTDGIPANFNGADPGNITYPGYGNYTVTVTSGNICDTVATSANLQILAHPVVNITATGIPANQCGPATVTIVNASQHIASQLWTISGPSGGYSYQGGTNSASVSPVILLSQPGTYTISAQLNNPCESPTWDTTFTVYLPPTVSLAAIASDCQTFVAQPQETVYNGGNPAITYLWSAPGSNEGSSTSTNPTFTYPNVGTYTISLAVNNGCPTVSDSVSFGVFSFVQPSLAVNDDTLCSTSATYQLLTTPSLPGVWSGTNCPPSGLLDMADFASGGLFTFTFTAGSGNCYVQEDVDIFIQSLNVNAGNDVAVCDTLLGAVALTGATPIGGVFSGAGVTGTNFFPNITGYGVHPVLYTFTHPLTGCVFSDTRNITVHEPPIADFAVDTVCFSEVFDIQNESANFSSAVWSLPGSNQPSLNTIDATNVSYPVGGDYVITMVAQNPATCKDTATQNIHVIAAITGSLSVSDNEICVGESISITTASNGEGISDTLSDAIHPLWIPAPANTDLLYPAGIFDTTYLITYEFGNVCQSITMQETVLVHPNPTASLAVEFQEICSGQEAQFGIDASINISTATLIFGNGNTYTGLNNQSQLYTNPDTLPLDFTVILNVTNQCSADSDTLVLTVNPSSVQAFISADEPNLCTGEEFCLTSGSTYGSALTWFFDDGTVLATQDTVCHAFATAGPHQVVLQAEGCGTHTDTLFLNVMPSPAINLQLGAPSVCDGEAVQINAATQGCDVWLHFGDGDTTLFDNATHVYEAPGTYTISAFALSIPDGCFADTSVQVLVRPLPTANLNLPPQPYCAPGVFVMTAAGSIGATFYNWSLSNGETAIGSNVSLPVQLPGQYQVSLTVSDAFGCSDDTLFYSLVVHERPDAAFTFTVAQLCGVPVNVTFTNGSVGASGFVWSSSNGQTSTQVAPTFTYAAEATYTVTLVASNQFFCTDTVQHDFATLAMPSATITADKEQICLGDSITLTALGDPYAQTFTWLLDNGVVIANADTAITYIYPDAGNYFPQLVVGNQGVCFDTTAADLLINVYPVPVAGFTFSPQTLPGSTHPTGYYDFQNTSQNASAYLWDFGDDADSDEENPTHRFLEGVHSYPVTLVATANTGCADTIVQMLATASLNGLYIPNAFTPGLPDTAVNEFRPKGANLVRFNVSVYSEWGDLVWRTTEQDLDAFGSPTRAWDGTLNGTPLPAGAYTWRASGIFNDGSAWQGMDFGDGRLRTEGTLMLIR